MLIVGIDDDASVRLLKGEGRPIIPAIDRAALVASLEIVDAVVIFNTLDLEALVAKISPDVLVKGMEYANQKVVGFDHAKRTLLAPMMSGISTTEIVGKIRAMLD